MRERLVSDTVLCISSGLLKSGLGRFGIGQSAMLPGQYSKVIILVLGGISIADMRAVKLEEQKHAAGSTGASAEGRKRPSVIVGGTSLLTAENVMHAFTHGIDSI